MTRIAILFLTLSLSGWLAPLAAQSTSAPPEAGSPSPPANLTELRVLQGDLLAGKLNGVPIRFALAGVWVPRPPGTGEDPEYGGLEAQTMVAELLEVETITIRALGNRDANGTVPAQILVGTEDPRDLAVLLADAGYALWESDRRVGQEAAQEVRAAERDARRGQRGIHDGGYQAFLRSGRGERDLGVQMWRENTLRPGVGGVASLRTRPTRGEREASRIRAFLVVTSEIDLSGHH
jgi:endonuclease YncB( thermonuclease family)